MSNYKNANGDSRDVIERYLPTAYKTENSANSGTYKGVLHALKSIVKTTENELLENTKSIFISSAKGPFLDLYGAWIGVKRSVSEPDDDYRKRVIKEITRGRATISNIIVGIKDELGNSVGVSIYETWRNIFILNQSLLNGPDHLMGKYYRYAVIEVTLDKYVPQENLVTIIDKYKAAGVMVLFTYSDSIVAVDGSLLNLGISLESYLSEPADLPDDDVISYTQDFKLNDLPLQDKDLEYPLFKTNKSSLNGTDKLSGSPRQLFSESYVGVPSLNIMGLIDKEVHPENYSNSYEYVYESSKILNGGRNLFTNSKTLPWDFGSNSNATVTVEDFDTNTKMYHIKSDKGHGQSAGMYIWGFCTDRGLPKGSNWSFSADIKGTGYINNFGAEGSANVITKGAIGTDWSRLSQSGVASNADHISLIMYFDTDKSALDVYIKLPKLETGNVPTTYTPAPEDNNPETYRHPYSIEDYYSISTSSEGKSFNNSGLVPTFVFDLSDWAKEKVGNSLSGGSYSQPIKNIVLKTGPAPFGLRSTSILINGQKNKGNWTSPEKGVSISGDTIANSNTSVGNYLYNLGNASVIDTVTLNDFYDAQGSQRRVYLETLDGSLLLGYRTQEQVLGTIDFSRYNTDSYFYLFPYLKRVSLGKSRVSNPEVFDYSSSQWIPIDLNTNLLSYATTKGDTPMYLLIRDNSTNTTISNLGLNISYEKFSGQVNSD